jgi:hypothetical protein
MGTVKVTKVGSTDLRQEDKELILVEQMLNELTAPMYSWRMAKSQNYNTRNALKRAKSILDHYAKETSGNA